MNAARKVVLESSLEGVPADWVFDHFKDVDEYNRIDTSETTRDKEMMVLNRCYSDN